MGNACAFSPLEILALFLCCRARYRDTCSHKMNKLFGRNKTKKTTTTYDDYGDGSPAYGETYEPASRHHAARVRYDERPAGRTVTRTHTRERVEQPMVRVHTAERVNRPPARVRTREEVTYQSNAPVRRQTREEVHVHHPPARKQTREEVHVHHPPVRRQTREEVHVHHPPARRQTREEVHVHHPPVRRQTRE